MKTDLEHYTIEEVVEGFLYSELEGKGLFGLAGRLVRADIIVGVEGRGRTATYETWVNVVARLKDQPARLPRRCHAVRNPTRVA